MVQGRKKNQEKKVWICQTLYHPKDSIRLKITRIKENCLNNVRNFRIFLMLSMKGTYGKPQFGEDFPPEKL